MPRPKKEVPSRRYHLTLDGPQADRLDAYADATRRPAATAAAALLGDALVRLDTDEGAELREARRQIEELTARVGALRRQLAERTGGELAEPSAPRWEWPLDVLLADAEWWDRWLPRLGELLGRRLAVQLPLTRRQAFGARGLDSPPVVDERGYADIMGFLFPPLRDAGATVTWRSLDYPAAADRHLASYPDAPRTLAQVWEPVIRHVAEGLCLLHVTGEPGADPYLRVRAEAEIVGTWSTILRNLVGEDQPDLPSRPPVPDAMLAELIQPTP